MAGAQRLARPPQASAGLSTCATLEHPIANDDTYEAVEDVALEVSDANGTYANDICVEPLEGANYGGGSGGTWHWGDGGGSFNFDPTADLNGTATAEYQFASAYGLSNFATVTINIAPVNDKPSYNLYPASGCAPYDGREDQGAYVAPYCEYRASPGPSNECHQDVAGHATTDNKELLPSVGLEIRLLADCHWETHPRFTTAPNKSGTAVVTFWITDDGGTARGGVDTSDTFTWTVNIAPVDDPPNARNDSYSTANGTQLGVSAAAGLLDNDTDLDGPARTASKVSGPSHGVVSVQPDGSFTYTPQAGFAGTDTFTYRATAGALHDDATASITVLAPGATPKAGSSTGPPAATADPTTDVTVAPGQSAGLPSGAASSDAASGPGSAAPSAAASPLGADPAPAAGANEPPWWILLLIVVVVAIGLNVGLYQYLRSRRGGAAGPPPTDGAEAG